MATNNDITSNVTDLDEIDLDIVDEPSEVSVFDTDDLKCIEGSSVDIETIDIEHNPKVILLKESIEELNRLK